MFFDISIKDIIDVVLVALMLYYMYRLMKDSGSLNLFVGILVFIFSWLFVSKMLQMRLLGSIFDQLMSVGTIALVIIFQEDLGSSPDEVLPATQAVHIAALLKGADMLRVHDVREARQTVSLFEIMDSPNY